MLLILMEAGFHPNSFAIGGHHSCQALHAVNPKLTEEKLFWNISSHFTPLKLYIYISLSLPNYRFWALGLDYTACKGLVDDEKDEHPYIFDSEQMRTPQDWVVAFMFFVPSLPLGPCS